MVIDYEYLKKLLAKFEESNKPIPRIDDLLLSDEPDNTFAFHMNILKDYGFIIDPTRQSDLGFDYDRAGNVVGYTDLSIRLTASGHEFSATLKQKEFWEILKSDLKDNSLQTLWSVGRSIAENVLKEKAGKYISGQGQ